MSSTLSGNDTNLTFEKLLERDFLTDPCVIEDRYEIIEVCGLGGGGAVFIANDRYLGNLKVAIKLFPTTVLDERAAKARAGREIRLTHRINHDYVVKLYDTVRYGEANGYSMELVSGKSLEELLPEYQDKSLLFKINLAHRLAKALHAIHSAGVIHRDIKPANIIVTEDALPKIIDFGVAKLGDEKETDDEKIRTIPSADVLRLKKAAITQQDELVGTPGYMTMEYLQNGKVTPRLDIYALGVTLYQLFTGKEPFVGENLLEILSWQIQNDPIPPIEINPEIPSSISDLLLMILSEDPEDSFESTAHLLEFTKRLVEKYRRDSSSQLRAGEGKKHEESYGFLTLVKDQCVRAAKTESSAKYTVILLILLCLTVAFLPQEQTPPQIAYLTEPLSKYLYFGKGEASTLQPTPQSSSKHDAGHSAETKRNTALSTQRVANVQGSGTAARKVKVKRENYKLRELLASEVTDGETRSIAFARKGRQNVVERSKELLSVANSSPQSLFDYIRVERGGAKGPWSLLGKDTTYTPYETDAWQFDKYRDAIIERIIGVAQETAEGALKYTPTIDIDGKVIPLTTVLYDKRKFNLVLQHVSAEQAKSLLEHSFTLAKDLLSTSSPEREQVITKLADIHYLLAHAKSYSDGKHEVTSTYIESLASAVGLKLQENDSSPNPEIEAYVSDEETYRLNYESRFIKTQDE